MNLSTVVIVQRCVVRKSGLFLCVLMARRARVYVSCNHNQIIITYLYYSLSGPV